MKIQPNKGKIKSIITITILIILLLLLIFSEDIVKLQNKNKIGLSENTEGEQIITEPNIPRISAGMIPIKWDGAYWEITTKNDAEWYDYVSGKPAYMMLNDGVYQSELIRDMEGKKLVEENIGAQIQETELGTIFMWIPRFEVNDTIGAIKYISDVGEAEEEYTIPRLFMYKQKLETAPDFLLTGVWVEKEIDASYSSKITEMNKEDGIYGFIANVVGVGVPDDSNAQKTIEIYANAVGDGVTDDPITDPTNTNRIILKIINDNNQDPIKAKGEYNKDTGIITVQVTYSKYGIKQILLEQTQELNFTKSNGIITADTTGIELEDEENTITIIDNNGNKKELKMVVYSKIFATLYTDGTLAFGKSENPIPTKTISSKYGDISGKEYSNYSSIPWHNQKKQITTVEFVNKIKPISTANWFVICSNLKTVNNIINLNTRNVTDMESMFGGCSSLTSLDVSNFDTSKVTDMCNMFNGCSNLTNIDVRNFDTSNVTSMWGMFNGCSNLTNIDVRNFDTSNVTSMWGMFYGCSGLTSIDVSNLDTRNVTDMGSMFCGCSGLTRIDVSNFDTSNVTNMKYMFNGCSGLTSLDVSNLDTRNVTDMESMFGGCSSLTSLDVSNFDTSKVTDMYNMFNGCSGLTRLDVSNLDTRNVTNMGVMFCGCSSLTSLDLSKFDTSNVTNMEYMFYYCSKLETIYVGKNWSTSKANTGGMFDGCGTSSVTRK